MIKINDNDLWLVIVLVGEDESYGSLVILVIIFVVKLMVGN